MKFIFIFLIASFNVNASIYSNESAKCIAVNVYHEARGESTFGRILVADVVLNRVKSKKYPNTICEVVKQHKQFSWYNGKSKIVEPTDKEYLKIYRLVRNMIYNKYHVGSSNGSIFYHTKNVTPNWSTKMKPIFIVGNHIFY